MEIQNRVNISS